MPNLIASNLTRAFIKRSIAYVLYYSGVLYVALFLRLRGRCIAVTYHRVVNAEDESRHNSAPGIVVSKKTFESNLRVIRSFLRPITAHELQSHFDTGTPLPSRSCLITFDDGWLDNYQIAGPLLDKYDMTASIFLASDLISSDRTFWQEELLAIMHEVLITRGTGPLISEFGFTPGNCPKSKLELRHYISSLKTKQQSEINRILQSAGKLIDQSRLYTQHDLFMTWNQVAEMQEQGISFGSHSKSHRILTKLSNSEILDELVGSKEVLEANLGCSVSTFAYPNGDYNTTVALLAKEAGYTLAFTTQPGFISHATNPLALPRVNIHDGFAANGPLFLCKIIGIF